MAEITEAKLKTLTRDAVKTAKPLWLWDNGFGVRATPRGKVSFYLQATEKDGTRRRAALPAATLRTALEARDIARGRLAKREKPLQGLIQGRALSAANTFRALWCDYVSDETHGLARHRTAADIDRRIQLHVMPHIGATDIKAIAPDDLRPIFRSLEKSKRAQTARCAQAHLGAFFKWCGDEGKLDASPLATVRKTKASAHRDRVLSDYELRLIWHACEKLGYPFGSGIRLLMLTGARREEVFGMSWSELDLLAPQWNLPAARSKNKLAHIVPLNEAMLDVIAALPQRKVDGYIFTTTGKTPVSGVGKAMTRLNKLTGIYRDRHDPSYWTPHDLRRTLVTGMAKLGVAPHIKHACVNHASARPEMGVVYDHYAYLDERRAAFDLWAKHLFQSVL